MAQTWRFAQPPKPEGLRFDGCEACLLWLAEFRNVRESNAKLARWRSKPKAETPGHTHG